MGFEMVARDGYAESLLSTFVKHYEAHLFILNYSRKSDAYIKSLQIN